MLATVPATYDHGVLRLAQSLPLPEQAAVMVTVRYDEPTGVQETDDWRRQSLAAFTATWNNEADEIFNELASK